jgi:hypothetical protein
MRGAMAAHAVERRLNMNFSECVFTVISIVEMHYFDMPCGERFSNRVAIQHRAGRHDRR